MMPQVLRRSLPRFPSFVARRRRSEVVVVQSLSLESPPSSASLQSSASSRSLGSTSSLKRRRSRRKIMDECTETGKAVSFSNTASEDIKVGFQESLVVKMADHSDEAVDAMHDPPTPEATRVSTAGTVITNGSGLVARKQVSFSKSSETPPPRRLDRSSSLRRSDERHIFCLSDQETLQALRTTILTETQSSAADRSESACMRGLELLKTPQHFDRRHDLKNMVIKSVLKLQRQRHLSEKDLQERMAKASLIGSEWARRFGMAIASSDEEFVNIVVYKKAIATRRLPRRWSRGGQMFVSTSNLDSSRRSERHLMSSTCANTENKQTSGNVATKRRHSSGSITSTPPRRNSRVRRLSHLLTNKR